MAYLRESFNYVTYYLYSFLFQHVAEVHLLLFHFLPQRKINLIRSALCFKPL